MTTQRLLKIKLFTYFFVLLLTCVFGLRAADNWQNALSADIITAESEPRSGTEKTTIGESVLAATTVAQDPVLFSDDFSSDLGWEFIQSTLSGNSGFHSLQDGELELGLNELDFNVRYVSPTPSDTLSCEFSITVSAHKTQGTNTKYGIVFNFVDYEHFYRFDLFPDTQEYRLRKFDSDNGGWITLTEGQSSTIRTGAQTNTLMLIRNCKQIRAFANSALLSEIVDDSFLTGIPGLFVGASPNAGEIPAAARFDNFVVRDGRTDLTADGITNTLDAQLLLRRIGQ